MSDLDLNKIVTALRDTANKAYAESANAETSIWIAGRLDGLADGIEAGIEKGEQE